MSSPTPPDLPTETRAAQATKINPLLWILGGIGLLLVCATLTIGFFGVRAAKNAGLAFRFDPAKRTLVMIGGKRKEVKIPAARTGSPPARARPPSPGPIPHRRWRRSPLAVEEPEAKFSALTGRAQELAQSLAGEAEVLPAVFTQVEPAESVFKAAADHGVVLVGTH
jgi:hypothetical protein